MIGLATPARPLRPGEDDERLVRMFRRLSRDTVLRRFFTVVPKLDGPLLRALTAVDHDAHEALVVPVGDEIVALASYHRRQDDPSVADVAVLVEDGWQHTGLGRRLTRQLSRLARERGITTFHADVMADNRPAIGLIHRMNDAGAGRFDHGELVFDLPLVPAAAA
jgi:GNAT superfamily N-acetyltransferase